MLLNYCCATKNALLKGTHSLLLASENSSNLGSTLNLVHLLSFFQLDGYYYNCKVLVCTCPILSVIPPPLKKILPQIHVFCSVSIPRISFWYLKISALKNETLMSVPTIYCFFLKSIIFNAESLIPQLSLLVSFLSPSILQHTSFQPLIL